MFLKRLLVQILLQVFSATAIKTKEERKMFRGVLFIDEAYALATLKKG